MNGCRGRDKRMGVTNPRIPSEQLAKFELEAPLFLFLAFVPL
jgi:hypothetical protein